MSRNLYARQNFSMRQCLSHGRVIHDYKVPVNAIIGHDECSEFIYLNLRSDYIKFGLDRQGQVSRTLKFFVLRYLPNPIYPVCREWQEVPVDPKSTLYTAILRLFGMISDPNQTSGLQTQLKPHRAGKDDASRRNQQKDLHRNAPKLRQSPPTTSNIFFRGQRHASYEKWNGNI